MPDARDDRSPVRLYRRGRIYWTWWYDRHGNQVRASTKCTSERAAAVVARRLEEEAAGGAPTSSREPYTVSQALDALLDDPPWTSERTLWSHESRAGQIARHIGDVDLAMLDRPAVEEFCEARLEEVSSHTLSKELVLLRLAIRKAGSSGHGGDPEAVPHRRSEYKPRERWLPRAEAARLLRAFEGDHHRRWILVALYTGARSGEVEGLDWSDIDWANGLLRIRGTKTDGADRVIPLADDLRRLLAPGRKSGVGRIVCSWQHAGRDIKAACKRSGLAPVTPNDLRRTTASWMAQAGVPPKSIADWLGHKSLDMVMRVYARVNPLALRPAADALPSLRVRCDSSVIEGSRRKRLNQPTANKKKAASP